MDLPRRNLRVDEENQRTRLALQQAELLAFNGNRLTWEKLEGMTASEINSRWDEVSSFLTCNTGKKSYD